MSERKVRKKNFNVSTETIYDIHQRILKQFESDYDSLPFLKTQFKLYPTKELADKIVVIESGTREALYLFKVKTILDEYDDILNHPVKMSFIGKTPEQIENECKKEELNRKYLAIAKLYTNIHQLPNFKLNCDNCNGTLQRNDDEFVCELCGCSVSPLITLINYQESERINSSSRYSYVRKDNFGISIKKFQGTQNITIPTNVYTSIYQKMEMYDMSSDQLTMDHLFEFLNMTSNSSYAEDAVLIFKVITGKKGPDISYLEEKLFEMFDLVDPVYEKIKLPNRINALNSQYLLFKFLKKLKYKCNDSDFYILKTREKLIEHDEMWKLICDELQWTFEPTV